jgi:hypothetical protein
MQVPQAKLVMTDFETDSLIEAAKYARDEDIYRDRPDKRAALVRVINKLEDEKARILRARKPEGAHD